MVWKCGKSIRQPELLERCGQEGKEWKRQTLNTFLARLEEKGLIRREKGIVSPIYTEEEYNAMQMREAIDTLYDGKLSNFLATFVKRNTVGEEEIAELQPYFGTGDLAGGFFWIEEGKAYAVYMEHGGVGECPDAGISVREVFPP